MKQPEKKIGQPARRSGIRRRGFLGGAFGGFAAYAAGMGCARALKGPPGGPAKRCLVLWMDGGPSQFETFDPKPGTAAGGPLGSIPTAVPGLQICETLPEVAGRMDKLTVLRNVTSGEGEHGRARYLLHTGYPLIDGFPRPSIGSVISQESGSETRGLPGYVALGSRGFGPAFLGTEHAPFSVEDAATAVRLMRTIESRAGRIRLTQSLDEEFAADHPGTAVEERLALLQRVERLIATPFVRALDVGEERRTMRERYGDSIFGQRCLLARRLLEAGVPFVEVQHGGWDTHVDNFAQVAQLCHEIDRPWAMLLDDLDASGLLEETLVIWMGEFGRTPAVNGNMGRDHFPRVTPVVVGGAGVPRGGVLGATSTDGNRIVGESVDVPDLFATLFTVLGTDPGKELSTGFGSMSSLTDDGQPIPELTY